MAYAGAICLFLALVFLIWRVQTSVRWIERIPLNLDLAAGAGLGGMGFGLIWQRDVGAGLLAAAGIGLTFAGLLTIVYGIAWLVGRVPGFSGVELSLEIPAASSEEALRWLRFRVERSGFVLEPAPPGVDLQAYQGGNPSKWDRRQRPKRLRARLEGDPPGSVSRLELRYVPPATGSDRLLRPFLDEIGLAEIPDAAAGSREPRILQWIEFLFVGGLLMFFFFVFFASFV